MQDASYNEENCFTGNLCLSLCSSVIFLCLWTSLILLSDNIVRLNIDDQPVDCPGSAFVREPAARSVVPDSYQQFQLSFFSLADINNCSCSRRRPVSGIPALSTSLSTLTNLKDKLEWQGLEAYKSACLQIPRKRQSCLSLEREGESKSRNAEPVVSRDRFQLLGGIFSDNSSATNRRHWNVKDSPWSEWSTNNCTHLWPKHN